MNKEEFVENMLCVLLNKFCNGHFEIDVDEFEEIANKCFAISYWRTNKNKIEIKCEEVKEDLN